MKTEVYSWRVSPELKTALEREARRRNLPVSAVLDLAVQNWLRTGAGGEDEEKQHALHQAAGKCFGSWESHRDRGSEGVRETVRERLRRRHGR